MIFKNLKRKIKKYNHSKGNILNIAPKLLTNKEVDFIKKKQINKLIKLNLFYKNKKFNIFFWKVIFLYIRTKKIDDKKFFFEIKKNIEKKNILELITIYHILLIIGKFVLAFTIRKYFYSKLNNSCFLFQSNYTKKIQKIDTMIQSTKIKRLKINKNKIKIELTKNFIKQQSDISKFIEGKTVALYGVGISSKQNLKELKNYNIVTLLNYFSKIQSKNLPKCQISYYSDYFIKNKKNIINKNLLLKYMMIKKKINFSKYKSYKVRYSNVYENLFFGTPSLLINAVLDIIKHNPKKIKIFNSTLYFPIHNKTFDPTQKKYDEFKEFGHVRSLGTHDIVSEFLIFRNLFVLKLIDVDNNLKNVLNMGIDAYLSEMESFYKKYVIQFLNN
jgi:hypothetical protein